MAVLAQHSTRIALLLFAWHFSTSSCAIAGDAVRHHDGGSINARQWETLDIQFDVDALSANAIDVDFTATFTDDSGTERTVSGFANGQREFLVRFTPPSPGTWRYETRSTVPGLDSKQGKLNAIAAAEGRRGGIEVDTDSPRRFRYENGESYYPIAFECDWLFALDSENPDGIPKTERFVDTIADNGFNQVVMNVFAYDVKWKKDDRLVNEHDYGSPTSYPFAGTNDSPRHDELNIDYFKRLDRVIEYLDQKGIAAHLMIYVWNKRVNWPEAKSDADNRYFDYVAKRYQAYPNLIWDVSKEALGYGHTDVTYIHDRIERLRELDAFDRLITVHDYGYCRRFTDNVDFVSVQLWTSELHSVMRKVCDDMPGKPILNIEHGGYERGPYVVFNGNYTSPEVCLERAYQCVFAGTFPTHYWQGAAWNAIVPDISSLPANERPRLDYYRHLRTLVEAYHADELIAGGKKSNAGFSLQNDSGDLILYYVPKECDFFGLRLPKENRGQAMDIQWFDPFTGKFDDPIRQTITQWPALQVPKRDGFRILILKIREE